MNDLQSKSQVTSKTFCGGLLLSDHRTAGTLGLLRLRQRQRAAYPSCEQSWYFQEYALACLTCVSILANFSCQVITHI